MSEAGGKLYDGKTSAGRDVTMSCGADGSVVVTGEGISLSFPLRGIRIDPRLGMARRMLRLPDGGIVETEDHRFLDELQRRQGSGGFFRAVHRWESSLYLVCGALVVMMLIGFGFFRYGVPFLAKKAAFALPPATEALMGRETLQILDRVVLKPSKLPEKRRQELRRLFSAVTAGRAGRTAWRIEFRSGESIGANAFALPAGIVVVTDKLVQIARSDDEIAGVLAHEVGHITHRHTLRYLMQNSATALLIATVTGDMTSITSLSATMPTVFIDAKYSRDFEREADDAAVEYLRMKGIPVRTYADMLRRLGEEHEKGGESGFPLGEWLSTHPQIEERVKRISTVGTSRRPPGKRMPQENTGPSAGAGQ